MTLRYSQEADLRRWLFDLRLGRNQIVLTSRSTPSALSVLARPIRCLMAILLDAKSVGNDGAEKVGTADFNAPESGILLVNDCPIPPTDDIEGTLAPIEDNAIVGGNVLPAAPLNDKLGSVGTVGDLNDGISGILRI